MDITFPPLVLPASRAVGIVAANEEIGLDGGDDAIVLGTIFAKAGRPRPGRLFRRVVPSVKVSFSGGPVPRIAGS